MPSLKEYILTLRQHNQGITNKAITLYLLKDGWKIEDIEKTFKEIDGTTEVSIPTPVAAAPRLAATPTISAIPEVQASEIPAPVPTTMPVQKSMSTPAATHLDLEIQPEELAKAPGAAAGVTEKKGIVYPSYAEIQHKIDPLIIPEPVEVEAKDMAPKVRPQFSYQEIMDKKPVSISAQPTHVEASADEKEELKKDPSVSYVRGSIVSGKGDGAFGVTNSPVLQNQSVPQAKTESIEPVFVSSAAPSSVSVSMPSSNTNQSMSAQTIPTPFTASNPVIQKPNRSKKVLMWIIIILIVLGGLGFGFMKYVYGVYLFVQPPFAKEDFVKGFTTAVAKINTAEYNVNIAFGTSERPEGAEQLDMDYMSRVQAEENASSTSTSTNPDISMSQVSNPSDELLRMIPQDAKLQVSISGVYDKTQKTQDGKFGFQGSYEGDGISVKADVESVKIGENVFAKINTFPSFFVDLTPVKDKWIKASFEDLDSFGLPLYSIFGGLADVKDDPLAAEQKKKAMRAFELFMEKDVFQVTAEPQKLNYANRRVVYAYTVSPNLENFIAFAEQLPVRMKAEFPDAKEFEMSPETLAFIKGKAFAYYFNYIKSHTQIVLAMDTKGVPVYIDVANTTAPKSNELKKQLNTQVHIDLINVNKKLELVAPTQTISFVDAYSAVTGKNKDEILFDQQKSKVVNIRYAIERYIAFTGETPNSLADLKKSTADIAASSSYFKSLSSEDLDNYYSGYQFATSSRPLYAGSFKDVYSEKDLTYQKTGTTTYQLIYSITFPPIPRSYYDLSSGPGTYDIGVIAPVLTPNTSGKPLLFLTFNNGLNTATEKSLSKESEQQNQKDTDKDKITDAMEMYLGLNIAKADTDGDKINDYDEVRDGTNPKGPGNWEAMFAGN